MHSYIGYNCTLYVSLSFQYNCTPPLYRTLCPCPLCDQNMCLLSFFILNFVHYSSTIINSLVAYYQGLLPGLTHPNIPYAIVCDEGFPLKLNMLWQYPGKNLSEVEAIFNYRLNRARHNIIENSFGILAARWCLFWRPIIANPN